MNAFMIHTRRIANSTRGFVNRKEDIFEPKIDRAISELEKHLNAHPKHKAVIFSHFLDSGIHIVKEKLENKKIKYGLFTGETPKHERDKHIANFNADKLRVLLVSKAGAEGLNLKGTTLIQILDPYWNNSAIKQVIGRGARFRSHAHLPPELQRLHVQKFIAVHPGVSADQYLTHVANHKEHLSNVLRDLFVRYGTHAAWQS
jgi:SNF2 family DNA or RNA helicase